jgi:molybdate transport system substrate-binding protein
MVRLLFSRIAVKLELEIERLNRWRVTMKIIFTAITMLTTALAGPALAAGITVIGSPGFREAYSELLPGFEKLTGDEVTTNWGGVTEVARRVAGGETTDVVILPIAQIDDLIVRGKLVKATRVVVGKSGVGVAVRMGTPKIDISSGDAVRKALLAASSIAYSTGPSGAHMADLIKNWGIADQLKARIVISPADTPVGVVLARGGAEIGFQQVSELIHVRGIDYLGPLPAEIQETTVFAAAVHKDARSPDAARALIRFLSAPQAARVIKNAGMDPG